MAVPTVMADLSTTAASNSPAGSESPISTDDFHRAIQSILRHTNAKGADIASATTTDIGAATGEFVDVTGTTTITGLGTIAAGIVRTVRFTGALTLTHNGTSLILPGAANITTAANDGAVFRSLGSGNWYCVAYRKADGSAISIADSAVTQAKLAAALRLQFNTIQDFRLTLTTAVPVTTSDVTGATTIYCTPYKGNSIGLYDGTNWNLRTSAEFSLALGTLTAALPYDVFCYDNAGTPTLEFLAWTNATTRATALAYQDGILIKSGDATRRYLGTFYTTATTTTEDSATKRFLWNYYHRAKRNLEKREATASWNYTTATYRQANNSTANQLDMVVGVSEDIVSCQVNALCAPSTAAVYGLSGIGLDSTSTNSGISTGAAGGATGGNYDGSVSRWQGYPGIGRHYLAWLEWSIATGTTQWGGSNVSGIYGEIYS